MLETLQNRAGRLVTGTYFRTPTDRLLRDLGWDKLTTRRQIHKLTLYHTFNDANHPTPNYITAIMPETRAHNTGRILRNANTHTIPANRTTSYQNSFFISVGKHWNFLHESIRSLPHSSFKRAITERLGVPTPPTFYEIGTKTGNMYHTRLRTGMSVLNSHLFQINKIETTECACCYRTENVDHFILSCPNYDLHRTELFQNISQTLGVNFGLMSPLLKLRVLLHGEGLGSDDGRAVAYHFQNFLVDSRRFGTI